MLEGHGAPSLLDTGRAPPASEPDTFRSEMSEAPIATLPAGAGPPLTQRLAETPPWSPLRLAFAIAGTLFATFFAVEAIFGRLPLVFGDGASEWNREPQRNFRLALVMILLVAYLPAAYAIGARGARRTVEELLPYLRSRSDAAELTASSGRFDPVRLRRAGWIGVAYGFAIPIWTDRSIDAWFLGQLSAEPLFQRVLVLGIGWFVGRFLYSIWAESRRLTQIGRDRVRVDLLDLRCFAPLTRQGLRYALLVVGVVSISSLNLFDYEKPGLLTVVVVANAVALAAAATALLLPLRGAHQAIHTAKRSELDWCDAELRRARAALEDHTPPSGTGTLADLVAWRGVVSAVPEWPLDAPTLRRFVLYLALPFGSWLGGAFVERVVDVALR